MNQIFSPSRFWLLIRRQWMTGKKQTLLSACTYYACSLAIQLFCLIKIQPYKLGSGMLCMTRYTEVISFMTFAVLIIIIMTTSAKLFEERTMKDRINDLMVPATTLERYLLGFPLKVLAAIVLFTVMFFLADLTAQPFYPHYGWGSGWHLVTPQLVNYAFSINSPSFYLPWLMGQSIYTLSSAYWHRKAFLKGTLAVCLVVFLVSCLDKEVTQAFLVSVWTLISAGCYVGSYLLLKSDTVVERHLTNYFKKSHEL